LELRRRETEVKNLVKLNKDGMTANIICDKADGSTVTVKIDIADLAKLAVLDYKWCVGCTNGTTTYCCTLVWDGCKKRRIYLHRFLMDFPNALEIDHVDGDGLNNTRSNLKIVNRQQNAAKMRLSHAPTCRNQLGVRGVTQKRNRYEVHFRGRYVGTFRNIDQAQRVYETMRTNINLARTGRA